MDDKEIRLRLITAALDTAAVKIKTDPAAISSAAIEIAGTCYNEFVNVSGDKVPERSTLSLNKPGQPKGPVKK